MNNTLVIDYNGNNYSYNENKGKSREPTLEKKRNEISGEDQSPKKINWKYILFPILAIIFTAIVVILCVTLTRKKAPKERIEGNTDLPIEIPSDKIEEPTDEENIDILDFKEIAKKKGPIEMEKTYKINTNVNDLKRIYVSQVYYEDIKFNGTLITRLVDRKTNYDIYVILENEPDEETKYFYNKTYTCSISVASECISSKDKFYIPRKLVDLIDQDYSNIRRLNQINSLENVPLPICIFNMTDNNVILM